MDTLHPVLPHHRAIVAVDIEGSTTRTNPARAQLRHVLYDLLEEALRASGIDEQHRDPFIDRGDGALVLIHPVDQAPKTVLLTTVIPTLSELLAQHDALRPDHRFRLRAAVHAGEVHYDSRGCYGEDVDITFRLLNAPELKRALRRTLAPLVLVVSQDIHRSVIRHGYDGIDDRAFEPLVHVQMAGQRLRGWVHVPDPKGFSVNGQDLTA
jgi:class 3 adenylate cyclase